MTQTTTIDPCADVAFPNDCADFDPKTVHLSNGAHGTVFTGEVCLVEASNRATVCCPTIGKKYGKAKKFTDDHPSISRVVRAFAIGLNDAWNDEDRQRLRPYVTRILGTKTTKEDEETRAWMATDWLARVHTPAFLRLAGLPEHAQALESLARIVDTTTARAAQPSLDAAESAARSAAGSAAESAARSAAGSAAESAAGSAARSAARSAAGSAAESAARSAARSAAGSAARSAARSAAGSAAESASRPTVELLQSSALELLDRMIAVGQSEAAA
jgi:hypothetical protein